MNEDKQLKDTVFLPRTSFPMKGDLVVKEPLTVKEWEESDIFSKIREISKGKKKFILHFGPPYANGPIHMGHALIGILKDAVAKAYQMLGYDAPLVLGWDCHGLPIEWKVEEAYIKQGKKREEVPVVEFMAKCREFAEKWTNVQKEGFKELGIISDFKNPYSTMDKESESTICEKFFEIIKKGLVYRGMKPVMWSVVEKTALAEAELEYQDKVSDAIFVKFPIAKTNLEILKGASAAIWTTTPWTIPGNRAIAYSNDLSYILIESFGEKLLIAESRAEAFAKEAGVQNYSIAGKINGEDLFGTICHHPLRNLGFSFEVPMLPGSHVTDDAGTGLVHTAPAHGLEDFLLGKEYDLPIENVVDADGTLSQNLPYFKGEHVFKVNPKVIDELQKSGNLICSHKITHSYPHSWRSKAPLIFRTTTQWFISISQIREKLLSEIDKTNWFPKGYVNRIRSMVEKRPDWCISRQRIWGVPIALFINKKTNEVLKDDEVFDRIVETFKKEGIEAWHTKPDSYFLGEKYNPDDFEKVKDTLEVWFDSACSHHYVLEKRQDLSWPADLYFEGSDQHRGWFQSSLVESVCVKGQAPYKNVATNGFVLDKDGRKMSKSIGNVVSPSDVISKFGADVLRLWALNSDYSEDIRIGDEILIRQQDVYRRFRNTIRYLLGVISDYKEENEVPYDELPELEKLILHNLYELDSLLRSSLKEYNFRKFYSAAHNFCSNDLSAFYFDIRKDSIYCDSPDSPKRLSCLIVMNKIFLYLVHWLAPVLSFTAEEAWKHYYLNRDKKSIFLNVFPEVPSNWNNPPLAEKWSVIKNSRGIVTAELEEKRREKSISSSLEADVCYSAKNAKEYDILSSVDFAEICIVSKSEVLKTTQDVENIVRRATGFKCDRCWRVLESVSKRVTANLCQRCSEVLTRN